MLSGRSGLHGSGGPLNPGRNLGAFAGGPALPRAHSTPPKGGGHSQSHSLYRLALRHLVCESRVRGVGSPAVGQACGTSREGMPTEGDLVTRK